MITTTELTQARAGRNVVAILHTEQAAREELDRLTALAPDAAPRRAPGRLSLRFESGGVIRLATPLADPRGRSHDIVIVGAKSYTDDLDRAWSRTLRRAVDDRPGGELRIVP